MKKLIAMLFVIALCVPSIFADEEHKVYSVEHDDLHTTAETITSSPCDVAFVIIDSTGTAGSALVRLLNAGTTMFAFLVNSSADTFVLDLSNTPVLFSSSLIVDSTTIDTTVRVTIIYRKKN